jgi:hypothetical protein
MKRVLLICPDPRPSLEALTGGVPLALAIFIGKPLIGHALDGLVRSGVTHVRILASDRPSEVRAYVLNGTAWGLTLEINAEPAELTPETAASKHAAFSPDTVLTLNALPQAPDTPILTDAASWHTARRTLLPLLASRQIGAREVAPGVWFGLKARADSTATLSAPSWVGPYTIIRPGASIGPDSYLEGGCLVDANATVEHSTIAPRTYLGSMMHLHESIASGSALLKWTNGSLTYFRDAFMLSPLDPPHEAAASLPFRLLAFLVLLTSGFLLLPIFCLATLAAFFRKTPLLRQKTAVLPSDPGTSQRLISYQEFSPVLPAFLLPGLIRRWPRLWRIVTGHFRWTGNPPLTQEEARQLDGEFEQLWLHTAPGFLTAPEAEGCHAPWDETARAHAALFACQPTTAWRWKIIRHGFTHLL